MRSFLMLPASLASVLVASAFGCSSIPDGAPQEFHLAKAAIDDANDADVDDILPRTVDRAKATLDEALTLYKKSDDKDIDRAARDQILRESTAKAGMARNLAEEAKALDTQVKAWDTKIEDHQSYTKMSAELQRLREQLVAAQRDSANAIAKTQATAGQTKVMNKVAGPVAFFGMGETQVKGKFTAALGNLAEVLKADPAAQVKLMGYTDSKGNAARNRELAKERAESVATILESMGVAKNQISVDGDIDRSGSSKSAADAQLARRVEASIVSGESPSMSNR